MPIKEQVTKMRVYQAMLAAISTNTTTVGEIFDTADYDAGVEFTVDVPNYTDGTYTLLLEHGDDAALADAATIPATSLVYNNTVAMSAATADGDAKPREGVHSTKRYVRPSIVSTGVTIGAVVGVDIIKHAEVCPTPQDA